MPQMAPYNWLFLNLLFTSMFMMYIIFLNFIPLKKNFFVKKKPHSIFMIKW